MADDCTTSFTKEDLKRLERAMSQGLRSVTFADGRRIEFSTFQEMVGRWNFIAQQLGCEAGREQLVSRFKKGVL